MLAKRIIKYVGKYMALALAIMCFPWAITLAFGNGTVGYIYETCDSGLYVELDKGKVDLEKFTAFVVAAQMDIKEEEEALKAQAVIVRTHIYRLLKASNVDSIAAEDIGFAYKIDSQLREEWGDSFPENYNKLMKIVENTSCVIIMYEGEPIKPYFHSSSSGYTRNGTELFEEKLPYLMSVQSSKDVEATNYLQGVMIEKNEFVNKLKNANADISISSEKPIETMQIISRCEAGYIESLQIGNVIMSGDEFAHIFELNSPNFQVDEYEGEIRIITKGMGHGLGLSMYGACRLAESGKSFEEIIKHYYTDVDMKSFLD